MKITELSVTSTFSSLFQSSPALSEMKSYSYPVFVRQNSSYIVAVFKKSLFVGRCVRSARSLGSKYINERL